MHPLVAPALIAAAVLSLGGLGSLAMDFDGDGLWTLDEAGYGTSIVRSDSDGDGLDDGAEARIGSTPTLADSDGDGVWDGQEGAAVCIFVADCDRDGVPDIGEQGIYDALDPDTFDVGLLDNVVKAFDDAGQAPTGDEDDDGIPDGWEGGDGLIGWDPFEPRPGQRDLLVEFVHVEGPRSGDFALDFTPSYEAVAAFFASEGYTLQWSETEVMTPTEVRPDFLTHETSGFYEEVILASRSWDNPYVTTVVLNPQQTQVDLAGNILGASFLRSMIVTVDYGAHTDISFVEESAEDLSIAGDGEVVLQPVMESHIIDARREQLRSLRFANEGIVDLGVVGDGDLFMVTRQDGNDFTWRWTPDWFVSAPNITTEDGAYLQLRLDSAAVDQPALAATIAHEIGHTLGLCHAHDPDCYQEFSPADQARRHDSTMSYESAPGTLHFLPTEWDQVAQYLVCPPQQPIALLAEGSDPDVFYFAKYEASFRQENSLRACGESSPLVADLEPRPDAGRDGAGWLTGYIALVVVVAGAAAATAAVVAMRRSSLMPPD